VLPMLGTDFPYRQFFPTAAKIAQVDLLPENLGRRCKLDLGSSATCRPRSRRCCRASIRRRTARISTGACIMLEIEALVVGADARVAAEEAGRGIRGRGGALLRSRTHVRESHGYPDCATGLRGNLASGNPIFGGHTKMVPPTALCEMIVPDVTLTLVRLTPNNSADTRWNASFD